MCGRGGRERKPIESLCRRTFWQVDTAGDGLPVTAKCNPGGARGALPTGRGYAQVQHTRLGSPCYDAELVLSGAVERQIRPLPDATCGPVEGGQHLYPLRPASTRPDVGTEPYVLTATYLEPAVGTTLEIGFLYRNRARPCGPLGTVLDPLRDPAPVALLANATVRMAVAGAELPFAERTVEQNLCFHPMVDVGSQMLAELAIEAGIDGVGGTNASVDCQFCHLCSATIRREGKRSEWNTRCSAGTHSVSARSLPFVFQNHGHRIGFFSTWSLPGRR